MGSCLAELGRGVGHDVLEDADAAGVLPVDDEVDDRSWVGLPFVSVEVQAVCFSSARGNAEAIPHGKTLWIHMCTRFM